MLYGAVSNSASRRPQLSHRGLTSLTGNRAGAWKLGGSGEPETVKVAREQVAAKVVLTQAKR